jgi:hypothetical protein
MKPLRLLLTAATTVLLVALFSPQNSTGQTAAPDAQTTAIIQEIRAQQKSLLQNQAAIDQKVADLGEQIRVARIFVSRAGKAGK